MTMTTTRRRLHERVGTVRGRADREKGCLRDVRVLGWRSSNGRVYSRECMADSVRRGLYEGVPVFLNHGRRPRTPGEEVGQVRGVYLAEGADGPELRGELWLSRRHPVYERIMEAAEDPDRHGFYALSHDATAAHSSRRGDGTDVIERLAEVSSVDLVHRGATNKGLYEAEASMNGDTVAVPRDLLQQLADLLDDGGGDLPPEEELPMGESRRSGRGGLSFAEFHKQAVAESKRTVAKTVARLEAAQPRRRIAEVRGTKLRGPLPASPAELRKRFAN